MTGVDWAAQLHDQLDVHRRPSLRPRLDGLSDAEYLWEPVADCGSVRRRTDAHTSQAAGGGDLVIDDEMPEPEPAPVTTVAWRLGHPVVNCLGMRNASHFAGALVDHDSWRHAATADEALDRGDS